MKLQEIAPSAVSWAVVTNVVTRWCALGRALGAAPPTVPIRYHQADVAPEVAGLARDLDAAPPVILPAGTATQIMRPLGYRLAQLIERLTLFAQAGTPIILPGEDGLEPVEITPADALSITGVLFGWTFDSVRAPAGVDATKPLGIVLLAAAARMRIGKGLSVSGLMMGALSCEAPPGLTVGSCRASLAAEWCRARGVEVLAGLDVDPDVQVAAERARVPA